MAEGLMHFCQNWGNQERNPALADLRYANEVEAGEPIPWLFGPEQTRIDDICRGCKESAFEIDEPKCPVCKTHNIEPGEIIKSMEFGPVKPSHKVFLYKCRDCNKYLTSHLSFF